jgi:hypothetical protein
MTQTLNRAPFLFASIARTITPLVKPVLQDTSLMGPFAKPVPLDVLNALRIRFVRPAKQGMVFMAHVEPVLERSSLMAPYVLLATSAV